MDLLIICLGTRKIMLQCITCRVQTSTLNISEKPTIVIIWIFYNMKNESVKARGGGGWGGSGTYEKFGYGGSPGPDKISPFHPPFQTECF